MHAKTAVTLALLAAAAGAHAQQDYPARPVRLIVTVPPGGAADLVARVMGQKLGDALGQVPGLAGGAILGDGRIGLILDVRALLDRAV